MARYAGKGYDTDGCLRALMADVADAYAERRGSGAVEGLLDVIYRNITAYWETTPVFIKRLAWAAT